MHFVTQQRQHQQQQPTQQQKASSSSSAAGTTTTTTATILSGTRFVSLCKSSSQGALPKSLATAQSLLRQSSSQQQQQRHKRAASLNLQSTPMRDSICDEITITTTTTTGNSNNTSTLSTIQEASGTLERSSISTISTSLSSTQNTSASAAPVSSNETLAHSNSRSSSQQDVEPANQQLGPQAGTPSITIVQTEAREQLQQQQTPSQSVDSNGQRASSSCTDSPSSRKSSTSSKGKPAKLSTSSSGRDEDAQSKVSESDSVTLRVEPTSNNGSSSTANEKPTKGTSRLSERAKKKSWYNVIYPNYKSRAEDFKKLFKEVPNEERLIVDYSCALQRDILVQGRLYVSQNYACFHANIFSWETYVSIKWKDVTNITKEKTALVIPNAISISTAKEKFFFATFASREKSHLMLFRVWQNTLMNKPFSPQEIWRYVHNCYGDELGLTSDDEDYIDPTLNAAETDNYSDFQTAIDDLGGEQSNSNQSINNTVQPQSGNSSASSGGGVGSATTRKSKTKYFFNSSKSSNLNSSANASASGSDNKINDNTRKSNKKMKTNAKELTLSSIKAAEQSVSVTLSVPSTNTSTSNNSTTNSTTTTNTTTTAPSTATAKVGGGSGSGGSGGGATASERKVDKLSGHAATATTSESTQNHPPDAKRKVTKNQRQRDVELANKNNAEVGPTDVSDSSDSEANNLPFVPSTECTSTHEGRQIVHTILPIRVDTLFNLLFSKSKFIVDFHEVRKSADLTVGEWHKNDDGQNVRLVNVTVQLAASVGPKTSKVTEFQTMRECSKPGELYSIDVNSVNAGIPYADSFSVLIHFCLARTVDDHTMLSIHAQIKYKKSIWGVVKGFIEKNTWAGLEDFFGAQLHALQSETCIPPAKGKGRRPRRGTATQVRPLEEAIAGSAQAGKPETLDNWDSKLKSAGVVVGAGAAAGLAHGAAGGGGAGSRQQKLLAAQQQHQLLAGGQQFGQGQDRFRHKGLSFFIIFLMCLLLALNVILLLKLWKLEEHIDVDLSRRARKTTLAALKELPSTNQDWLELLRQQELSHEMEIRKWHQVLETSIELLKKTEKTLAEVLRP
ncbi:protein Aster-B isoform X2 [Drosophila grimshawi]|nr:protein Aster-B isoform X2 [Drosophila grimshawi]